MPRSGSTHVRRPQAGISLAGDERLWLPLPRYETAGFPSP